MIKRLARCIREYKWATILSPVCMIGEVAMEVTIPLVAEESVPRLTFGQLFLRVLRKLTMVA